MCCLIVPIPHSAHFLLALLLHELEYTIHESLSCWRAPWNVNIDWNNAITASNNRVRVMIVPSSISTGAH